MHNYDPDSIVSSYSSQSELTRLGSSADTEVMFEVERWFVEKHLPADGTVIDIGAGPGRYSVEMAKLGRDVVVTDLTPMHIEQARQLAAEQGVADRIAGYRVVDVCDGTDYTDGQFSMVLCYGMLNYTLDNDVKVLAELKRIVKPGGTVLVSVMGLYGALRFGWAVGGLESTDYLSNSRRLADTGINTARTPHRRFYTAAGLRSTAEKAGLQVVEMAGTPVLGVSLGAPMEEARKSADTWEYVIEMEKRACTVPGLVDAGQHLIAVTKA